MRDGFQSQIKIARPSTPPVQGSPPIVYIFGDGFIAGSYDSGTAIARGLVRLFNATVVLISYRLAPEHEWPTSWDDAWDNREWLAEHASEVGADPTKGFIIGRISAGGTLSTFITAESQTSKLKYSITGQWLFVPSPMSKANVLEKYKAHCRSIDENINNPVLPESVPMGLCCFIEWDDESPMHWPVLYDLPLSILPPTYLQADGMDPNRDDSLIYHEMLREAGARTRIDFYFSCPHAHFLSCLESGQATELLRALWSTSADCWARTLQSRGG